MPILLLANSESLTRGFVEVLGQTLWLLLVLVAPFVVFTVLIHFLERLIQIRLASRFGWKSVLWTGWLGTPIHELSHVVLCKIFRHRVEEVALFEPDLKSGRLGYVKHTWIPGNWFEEVGTFFIGLAPLAGGSLALAGLLWFFFPEAVSNMIASSGIGDDAAESASVTSMVFGSVQSLLQDLLAFKNLVSWKFWLFTYLVLCVGSHMAPSRSDYQDAGRATIMVLLALAAMVMLVTVLAPDPQKIIALATEIFSPLFAVMVITVILCCVATLIVSIAVSYFPQRYRVG